MPTNLDVDQIVGMMDRQYPVRILSELAKVPTEVPLGADTFIDPDDPKLVHYVQQVLRPELQSLGIYDIIDVPGNQLIVRYGEGTSNASLLVMVYTPTQHHNLMQDPLSGKIARATEWGFDEPCVFGQGVGQNKSHQAIMLAVLKALVDQKVKLSGNLFVAVNNEGRSSHRCSNAILSSLDTRPDFAILMTRTSMGISLGNRGRVDANIEVRGKATHSSVPEQGLSAIEGANQVLNRLKQVPLEGTHPLLGGRHALAYQVIFEPLAPHTLPEVARIRVDRRLLPGDEPGQAVDDIRNTIGDMSPYDVQVEAGEYMLPALVDPECQGVRALKLAHQQVVGAGTQTYYGHGTFDAGGPCAAGVPAVMYGVGGGVWPLGVDFVPVSQINQVSGIMLRTILDLLG